MNKFKVGDTVKILSGINLAKSKKGHIGIVIRIDHDSMPYCVKFKDGDFWFFHEKDLDINNSGKIRKKLGIK